MSKDDYISDKNLISANSKIKIIHDKTIILDDKILELMKDYDIDLVWKDYYTIRKAKFNSYDYFSDEYFLNRRVPFNPVKLCSDLINQGMGHKSRIKLIQEKDTQNSFKVVFGDVFKNQYYFRGSEENLVMFRLNI